MKREKGSYFLTMFETMLSKTSEEQLKEIVFVIFLSENDNITWKHDMAQYLNRKYQTHVKSGSLLVIEAPLSFYASMVDHRPDKKKYWQTKQNYDYAYIMKYSRYLSEFYMQMEDDVITVDNYYPAIMNYINAQKHDKWVCMEFSELGFIGKLYHSRDIARLGDMLLVFANEHPCDVTYLHFNRLAGQKDQLLRKPTLFQHVGVQSSLAGKVQPLKDRYYEDKYYDFPKKKLKGDNPTAKVHTSFEYVKESPPELAYENRPGYFWSRRAAKINDTFTIVFEVPCHLKRVVIVSGSKHHPADIINSASVEAGTFIKHNRADCSNFIPLGEFNDGVANITTEAIKTRMPFSAACLRIRITGQQTTWVIIREIAVFIYY